MSTLGALGGAGLPIAAKFGGSPLPPMSVPSQTLQAVTPQVSGPIAPPMVQHSPAPNAITAPEAAGRAEKSALSMANVSQRIAATGSASSPTTSPSSSHWSDYVKDMMNNLQNNYDFITKRIGEPLSVPNIPGGQELADSMQKTLVFQAKAMEFQVGMAAADHVRSTAKAVSDKMTDMKD